MFEIYFEYTLHIVLQKSGSEDWKIDGIAMRKLDEIIATPMYMRWNARKNLAITTKYSFMQALRFDYTTDWLFLFVCFNFIMSTSLFG